MLYFLNISAIQNIKECTKKCVQSNAINRNPIIWFCVGMLALCWYAGIMAWFSQSITTKPEQ